MLCIDFEYFIYENNSSDNTKQFIENFAKNHNCKYLLEDIPNSNMLEGIKQERGQHMATIRNKFKDFHGNLNSDYTLLLDCDVVFLPSTIEKLIQSFDDTTSIVSAFCIDWNIYRENNKYIHYYDTLAVISNDNISYKENGNTCLFKTCERCICHRGNHNIHVNASHLFDDNKIIRVKSAFGSMSMIKTEIYNKVRWGNSLCEHHSFCEQINKFGNVVINPNIKIFTTTLKHNNYDIIKIELQKIVE
jgi:hypothetical protein